MDNIKDIVQGVIGKLSHRGVGEGQRIKEAWEKTVSDQEQKHAVINEFSDGMLIVAVDSSAWLYQMNTKKTGILTKLKKECPEIKKVYFKIGKIT